MPPRGGSPFLFEHADACVRRAVWKQSLPDFLSLCSRKPGLSIKRKKERYP